MASYSGGIPIIGGAQWSGNAPLATKNQLLSSIAGLYADIQDIELSSIVITDLKVSTLTAAQWISTPELYVSSIIGGAGGLTISTGDFSFLSLSTLSFKGIDLGGLDLSLDLGLGDAAGGALAGLGALAGGALLGLGTGAGLGIKSLIEGIASFVNSRGGNVLNNSAFETINGSTQLQISTLNGPDNFYSSIFRTVSSVSANEVPGPEIFLSTIFPKGTTCIRSVSDPLNIIIGDSNIAASTLQSFGQWVPFLDPTVTSEDIYARYATFSTLTLNTNNLIDGIPIYMSTSNALNPLIVGQTTPVPTSNDLPIPFTFYPQQNLWYLQSPFLYNDVRFPATINYISTPFVQFQSTLTTQPGPIYFITSSISTPAKFTWAGLSPGDFAICEPDETGFRSTATFDFQAVSQDLFIQWGFAVDNRNSTIGAGTAKRVSWDNDANTSNFIDIPVPVSTIVNENLPNIFQIIQTPFETRLETSIPGPQGNGLYLQATSMRVSPGQGTTSSSNYAGYNFQFDGSMYVTGVLEADTLIAISSILAVSTNIQTFFSTTLLEADAATIISASITTLNSDNVILQSTAISSVGISNAFVNMFTANKSLLLSSILLSTTISNAYVDSLEVNNLLASNIVYSNAEAPTIQTSTISFGYTGNFSVPPSDYPLNFNVVTPTGLSYTSIPAASNQVLTILNASNTVNTLTTVQSTPFTFYLASFGAGNIQGWASTMYVNAFSTTVIAGFSNNTPPGQVYIQGGPFSQSIVSCLRPNAEEIIVRSLSTYTFTSDGSTWSFISTFSNPTGAISYSNATKMFMDFERFTISTTDTLVLSADVLQVNATTNIPNLQANVINTSNLNVNPLNNAGGINTLYNKPITIPFNTVPTQVQPLQMSFTEQSPDGIPQYGLIPPFMGSNSFTSYNVSSWNNTLWNNNVAFSLGAPAIYMGDVQTFSPYFGSVWINNTIRTDPSYALPVYFVSTTGTFLLTSIPGGNYGQISTTNGVNWTTNTNAPNPLTRGGSFSNIVTFNQTISQTTMTNTQNLAITAPNTTFVTGSMNLYADQIRVNSRTYGYYPTTGLPSFPIGIENNVYIDSNMAFTQVPAASGLWESVAQNVLYNLNNTIFYDAQTWILQVIPSRFRTNANYVLEWDVEPGVIPNTGGTGYVWVIDRYIYLAAGVAGPGTGANNWNWYMAIPRNYCTFLT